MKTKQQKLEILYCIALVMLLLRQLSGMMAIVPYFSLIASRYGNIVLLVACITLGGIALVNTPIRLIPLRMILMVWGIATYFISNTSMMLLAVLMILAARGLNKRKMVLVWFTVMATVLAVAVVAYIALFSGESDYIQYMGLRGVTRMRYYFFFNHPNSAALCFLYMVLAFVYLWYDKVPFWGIIAGMAMGCIFEFVGPCSYTSLAVIVSATIFLICNRYLPKIWHAIAYAIVPLILIGAFVGVLIFYCKNIEVPYNPITYTLVMRFEQGAAALALYPVNLWGQIVSHLGQDIEWHGKVLSQVSMDMGYVAILIYYGIVGFLFSMLAIIKGYYAILKEKKWVLGILLTTVVLYGVMEWPALYPILAFPILLLSDYIRRNDRND